MRPARGSGSLCSSPSLASPTATARRPRRYRLRGSAGSRGSSSCGTTSLARFRGSFMPTARREATGRSSACAGWPEPSFALLACACASLARCPVRAACVGGMGKIVALRLDLRNHEF
eukprot:1129102-Prymnesium_polylepis.2